MFILYKKNKYEKIIIGYFLNLEDAIESSNIINGYKINFIQTNSVFWEEIDKINNPYTFKYIIIKVEVFSSIEEFKKYRFNLYPEEEYEYDR